MASKCHHTYKIPRRPNTLLKRHNTFIGISYYKRNMKVRILSIYTCLNGASI